MAINLGKSAKPSKALLKTFLRAKIKEEVDKLKIERATERENINTALGVGDVGVFVEEFNSEYANTRAKGKDPKSSPRKLKKVSDNASKGVL